MSRDLILQLMRQHQLRRSAMPMIPMERALPLFSVQLSRLFIDETSQDSQEELSPQVISKPSYTSCVEYEAGNVENVNPQTVRVKEEVIPSESSEADKIMTNRPASPGTSLPACPKFAESRAHNQKASLRIQGSENRDNWPTKVAQRSLLPIKRAEV